VVFLRHLEALSSDIGKQGPWHSARRGRVVPQSQALTREVRVSWSRLVLMLLYDGLVDLARTLT